MSANPAHSFVTSADAHAIAAALEAIAEQARIANLITRAENIRTQPGYDVTSRNSFEKLVRIYDLVDAALLATPTEGASE